MSKIEELISELCPDGVEYKNLGDICEISKGVQFNKINMKDSGTYPVINGGINPSGFIEKYNQPENTITIAQGGSAGFVNWISTKFWAGAHCYVIKPRDDILNRFLFHFLKSKENFLMECQYGATIPALAKSTLEFLQIPIPPIKIQSEIVRILDTFSNLISELNTELILRKKQFQYYRDQLLTFGSDVDFVNLGDVATVTKLAGFEFTKYVTYSNTGNIIALRGLNVKDGHLVLDDVKYIDGSNLSMLSRSKLQINDILFTYVGTVGQVALIDKNDKYYLAPNVALVRINENFLYPKFVMYYFLTSDFKIEQIGKLIQSSSMENISMEKIRKFKIPVPPIEQQKKIVTILDKFDKICNDLTSGIPAEINARKKQYEYYRDKLLTFSEIKKEPR